MTEEAFLRAILASPEDETTRLVYADWLEERGDTRAAAIREAWGHPRIRFTDWAWVRDNLAYYLERYPDLREEVEAGDRLAEAVAKFDALRATSDEGWLAFMDSLGRPFRPFLFFNNTGPRSFDGPELPFSEPIGTRGTLITFASSFRDASAWRPGLLDDLRFLRGLPLGTCSSGAATVPLHPFLCEIAPSRGWLTGTKLLRAIKARAFRSDHIASLDATEIPFPGYNPYTANDWVHTDGSESHMFPSPADEADPLAWPGNTTHDALRSHVTGRLWYALLHCWPKPEEDEEEDEDDSDLEFDRHRNSWVVLFAIGKSRDGRRLVGVVTHQACHNFCD